MCAELNIPLAKGKTLSCPYSYISTFVGLEINTMFIRIPQAKIDILKQIIQEFLTCRSVLLKELESLVGMFIYFGKAIKSRRAFNRRFYDAMKGASEAHLHVRLSAELRENLGKWARFVFKSVQWDFIFSLQ